MKFKVRDALGNVQEFEAPSVAAAIDKIETNGRRNVYGLEWSTDSKFFLDREGKGLLYPITVQAAAMELNMGGFEE